MRAADGAGDERGGTGRVWGQAFGREPDLNGGYVAFTTVLLNPSPELAARLERDAARC